MSTRWLHRAMAAFGAAVVSTTAIAASASAVPFGSNGPIVFSADDGAGAVRLYRATAQARPHPLPGSNVVFGPWELTQLSPLVAAAGGNDSGPTPEPVPPPQLADHRIAFESDRDGDYDLWTVDFDGKDLRQVTDAAGSDLNPSWASANRIVFERHRGARSRILAVDPETGVTTALTDGPMDISPAASPDGTHVAFARARRGNLDLYVMNIDGSGIQRVTATAAPEVQPSWFTFQPSSVTSTGDTGDRLVYTLDRAANAEIYSIGIDGSRRRRLTSSQGDDVSPSWSSSGAEILFSSTRDGNLELYVMNTDGTGQTRLTSTRGDELDAEMVPGSILTAFRIEIYFGPGSPRTTVRCTRAGSAGADRRSGGPGRDVLCGFGGNDRLSGRGGRDVLSGGSGNDRLNGGPGNDKILAKDGRRDVIKGGKGSDIARYDRGRDVVSGIERHR
jgi:Ca2+-binding RTX toxin-like protein